MEFAFNFEVGMDIKQRKTIEIDENEELECENLDEQMKKETTYSIYMRYTGDAVRKRNW